MSNRRALLTSLLVCTCVLIGAAAGQDPPAKPPAASPTPFTTRGAFIGVSVADIDKSVAWYTEKLGLTVVLRPPPVDKSTAVILEGGGLIAIGPFPATREQRANAIIRDHAGNFIQFFGAR